MRERQSEADLKTLDSERRCSERADTKTGLGFAYLLGEKKINKLKIEGRLRWQAVISLEKGVRRKRARENPATKGVYIKI